MSSLIFKNTVLFEDGLVWFSVDEKVRPQIKQGLLSLLADNEEKKVKASSYGIGSIASVEVPKNLWDDFLPIMTQAATSEPYNETIRSAAMQTIEFMSDFLGSNSATLSQQHIGHLLHCTVSNITDRNTKITEMALKALARILPNCSENFKIESQRQLIMTAIISAIKMPQEEIQVLAF